MISLERFSNNRDLLAYNKAQRILVTRLHPVWISDFIIENWSKWYWTATNSKFFKKYKEIKNN